MRFLRLSGDRQLLPTTVWATVAGQKLNDVKFSVEQPPSSGVLLTDIKDWLVTNPDDDLLRTLGPGEFDKKKIQSHAAATGFLKAAVEPSGVKFGDKKVWILLPSFRDEETRKRYKKNITAAVTAALDPSEVSYLFEPEMVLEYFRLCRGDLVYPKGQNPIYLIVDCGALTCNVTLVMGTRFDGVGRGTVGRHRSALHPVGGDSIKRAGRWIDERLGEKLPADLGDPSERLLVAEHVKIELSRSNAPISVVHTTDGAKFSFTPSDLERELDGLIDICAPVALDVLSRGYEQMTRNERYAKSLASLGITDGASFARALTAIVFSGGTTLLPGFRDKFAARLQTKAPMLHVGDDYAQAAAMGAMCHILDSENVPSNVNTDGEPPPIFLPSLHEDIQVEAVRPKRASSRLTVLTREQWSQAVTAPVERTMPVPVDWPRELVRVQLVWAGLQGKSRFVMPTRTNRVERLTVGRDAGAYFKTTFTDSDLHLQSFRCAKNATLHAHLASSSTMPVAAEQGGAKSGAAVLINDVVLDFGMSKLAFVVPDAAGMSAEKAPVEWVRRPLGPDWRIYVSGGDTGQSTADASTGHEVAMDPPLPAFAPTPPPSIVAAPVLPPVVRTPILPEVVLLNASTPLREDESGASVQPDTFVPTSPRPPSTPTPAVKAPIFRPDADTEIMFLEECFRAAEEANLDIHRGDIVAMHLAAKTRPFIMLAGSPGIGKTSLAIFYASMLGCRKSNGNLDVVHVQPDWVTDAQLITDEKAPLRRLLHEDEPEPKVLHGIVLDEMNLSRPDYYLMRLLATLDKASPSAAAHMPFPAAADTSLLVFATLNVDEASRPPSDKVLDRGFVLEPARPAFASERWNLLPRRVGEHPCVSPEQWRAWTSLDDSLALPPQLRELVDLPHINVSRRAVWDIAAFLAHGDKFVGDGWPTRAELLDRAVFGRLLPRLRGDARSLLPVVDGLFDLTVRHDWLRTRARLEMMKRALSDGYATFWCE